MVILFSSKDLKTVAREIISRQAFESSWTDENGKKIEINDRNLSTVDLMQKGIEAFVEEIARRYPVEGGNEKIDYFAPDTPRLTESK